ncbi:MAG: undecaprenyl/decaprenyl-phosphate alpha-N-acetylglucosaminyl 1-phosphate transferase [Planctomycetota bacterium]|nr:MAG: undecaprenyl/decaprenyl-phosphate alpha-N-acetylglucosaminyl 1-phosphate transferase [Planctomycetota bacterium]
MSCDAMTTATRLDGVISLLINSAPALLASFAVTVVTVPIVRWMAHRTGVVDTPDGVRKLHGRTVAYLGGVGVFIGVFAGIIVSAWLSGGDLLSLPPVPFSVVLGMIAITFTGLADDIWKFDARLKIAGQLVAAAALAIDDIGINVASGLLSPIIGPPGETLINLGGFVILNATVFYWVGTALVATFVLGGSNAANLLDGLDGLLSGITVVMCLGLLALSLLIVFALPPDMSNIGELARSMAGVRVVLCLSLLGACLGFLVYNFNPATIFLGDAGSLLIGFLSVTIIMTFANLQPFSCPLVGRVVADSVSVVPGMPPTIAVAPDAGYEGHSTLLVMCGLAMFGLPILDTALAVIRRRRAGVPFSTPDANHIHHRVKRACGDSVRKAVSALYGMEFGLVLVGIATATYVLGIGGRLLWPFLFLVGVFLVLLALATRGSGATPTGGRRVPRSLAADGTKRRT